MRSEAQVTRWVEQGWIGPRWLAWAWAGPMAAGIGLGALALAGLDGGIAGWARHAGHAYEITQAGRASTGGPSLAGHVAAMLLLAAFTVAVTATLIDDDDPVLALAVLIAVTFGPMTVIAA